MIKSYKKFEIYDKKVKISQLNFKIFKEKPSFGAESQSKCGTVTHSFGSSFTRCQDRPICMANSSESASFGLSNGPALGLGFLLPCAAYTAYFVLYEAFGTVTNSREFKLLDIYIYISISG